jgi:murein DD-endopeptidase MepM/ murein hydrolase activator NlpD
MRRIGAVIILLALVLAAGHLSDYARGPEARRIWNRLAMPYRLARLQLEPPAQTLMAPVRGLDLRKVSNTWHAERPGGRRHQGQDLFAPRGTPVVAATRGVVIRVANRGLGGNTVSVFGPGGRTYYYAHLDSHAPGITPGDFVEGGTVLGFVGNTGNARNTPPHLHFGVYGPGGAIDPLPDLKRSSTST